MGRHKPVSHGVGINLRFVFVKSIEFFDEGVEGFWIIFVDVKFNTGGVKGKDTNQPGIYYLADGLCIIHHLLKHEFNIRIEVLFETCQKRDIGHLGKAA